MKTPMLSSTLASCRRGFTLAEMVIVIAVLAVLVSISTPAIFQFIRQRDIQSEENTQLEIRKALQAYLADKNVLPAEDTWFTDLGGYTNLSTSQMENDVWGRPRSYIMYKDPSRNLQGSPVEIYYATLISSGPNGQTTAGPGIAVQGTALAAADDVTWWSHLSGREVSTFSALQPSDDDIMTRFTDYPEKLDRYNLTLQRLDRVAQSLESYSKNAYANKIATCNALPKDPATGLTGDATCDNGAPELVVYYPKSLAVAAQADSATYYNATIYVDNSQNDATRRSAMQGLMHLLGLPDDFCCSALQLGTDDEPKAFYYFSNPRPRNSGGGCGARPGAGSNKLPARITTVNDDTAAVNPTCG
ncbi:MAG: prepilin-type N-terminal cleavage/methylation domain-containing protein [Proteobacteria bacterium]|nr:prepilin-type N-terminal cleavage/methylation domain-containing protein [Pseudomonadota bacterium]